MTVRRRGSSIAQPVAIDIQDEVVIVVFGASGDLAKKKTVSVIVCVFFTAAYH